MRICVVSGSRADYGLLEWPVKLMEADPFFHVEVLKIWNFKSWEALRKVSAVIRPSYFEIVLLLGDRFEIMGTAMAAHLARIPIAHIAGGDVTEGAYDDAMRDCISRMASIHFATSTFAVARLVQMGCRNVHLVGSPGIDYIKHADWKRGRPLEEHYVVVSYQPETIDGKNEMEKVFEAVGDRRAVIFLPNPDKGSDDIASGMRKFAQENGHIIHQFVSHADYLNLIYHCDEFIGNSSSMLYEAPELGVKTRMIGKRQKGRTIPMGDGNASQRILNILKYTSI